MGLQDPFTFFTYNGDTRTPAEMPGTNGKVVTEEDWIERRKEIKDLLMYYWYGYKWDTPRGAITSVSLDPPAANGSVIDHDDHRQQQGPGGRRQRTGRPYLDRHHRHHQDAHRR